MQLTPIEEQARKLAAKLALHPDKDVKKAAQMLYLLAQMVELKKR